MNFRRGQMVHSWVYGKGIVIEIRGPFSCIEQPWPMVADHEVSESEEYMYDVYWFRPYGPSIPGSRMLPSPGHRIRLAEEAERTGWGRGDSNG
mgnify:CR=1 FL=1